MTSFMMLRVHARADISACEGRYKCMRGPIWVHVRANMGSHEQAVMGLASRAVLARVLSILLLFLVKHVIMREAIIICLILDLLMVSSIS